VPLLFLFFHKRLCGPIANSRFHNGPDPRHRPNSRLEAAYHRADKAIQKIVDVLAAAQQCRTVLVYDLRSKNLRILEHGWPQGFAVSIMRRVRLDLEREHARILRQRPDDLCLHRARSNRHLNCTPFWRTYERDLETEVMPHKSVAVKRDRMHLRLDAKTKRKLARAAAYEQTSISDFVLGQAMAAADRVIEAHEKVTLSAADWDAFFEALMNPPEPNKKLRAAVRRYRERVGG
jgi:uncharacterized protein (DUF1778 family)